MTLQGIEMRARAREGVASEKERERGLRVYTQILKDEKRDVYLLFKFLLNNKVERKYMRF